MGWASVKLESLDPRLKHPGMIIRWRAGRGKAKARLAAGSGSPVGAFGDGDCCANAIALAGVDNAKARLSAGSGSPLSRG